MGGAPQPNAKGKFTRSGRVLGRSTPDVNDHYDFHEVRFKPNPPLDARAPSPRAERVSRLSRFASRTLADVPDGGLVDSCLDVSKISRSRTAQVLERVVIALLS